MPQAREIAEFLDARLAGPDVQVTGLASLNAVRAGAMVYAARFDERLVGILNACAGLFAVVSPEFEQRLTCCHVVVARPRLAFARAAARFFAVQLPATVARTAVLGSDVSIGPDVGIGEYCVIGEGARIGEGSRLLHHVVIGANCAVGRSCVIKSHTVIGEDGFGYEPDERGRPVKLPHVGRVVIGDGVHLGNFNSIDRATLDETRVGDHVKTDDHVHIGHNSAIGENSLLTACVEISGSVKVGRDVWIGPNSSIIDGVSIGDRAFIGIGSVVTKDVPVGASFAGNPARRLIRQGE